MTRLSKDELDDLKNRNPIADVARRYVKLRKSGGRLLGSCPLCGGKDSSSRFEVKEKEDTWVCAACNSGGDAIRLVDLVEFGGKNFRGAVEKLGGALPVDPEVAKRLEKERERKRLAREKESNKFREAERTRSWNIWQPAVPIHDTVAARYLAGRDLTLPEVCPGLRFLPAAQYYHGEEVDERGRERPIAIYKGPTMLAAFIRPDGTFGGVHMTYLADGDPPRKVELHDPETGELLNPKKMRGSKSGSHIAITMTEEPKRLVVGEGIETVLSIWTAMRAEGRDVADMAFWAAGDLGNAAGKATKTFAHPTLKQPDGRPVRIPNQWPDPDDPGLSIPDSVSELILLGDGDSEQLLTECAMERAARRYARPGRVIRIAFAPQGEDFNDVLRSAAAA